MILYNSFIPELSKQAEVIIWAKSFDKEPYASLSLPGVKVQNFPKVRGLRFKYELLRRLNDYTWDAKGYSSSRKIFWHWNKKNSVPWYHHLIRAGANIVNVLGLAPKLESISEKQYITDDRTTEATKRLQELKPDLVLCMSPFRFEEPGIIGAAKKLRIKTAAFITSWDNITTKNRIMFDYDAYFVWSQQMKSELIKYYPYASKKPIYITGAPQYDVFSQDKFRQSREDFAHSIKFDPTLPIITYALGSPGFLNELPGAFEFLRRVAKGDLGNVQIIIRPHPLFISDPKIDELQSIYPKSYIQRSTPTPQNRIYTHDESKIYEWVNTYRHSDVIIQLASTVAVDAAILDRPVVNINFDPSEEKTGLVKEFSRLDHFAPIVNSNGIAEANSYDDIIARTQEYIKDPSKDEAGRKEIVKYVCEYADGQCGNRFADSMIELLNSK